MRDTCANSEAGPPANRNRLLALGVIAAVAVATTVARPNGTAADAAIIAISAFTAVMCWSASSRFGLRGGFAWRLLAAAAVVACIVRFSTCASAILELDARDQFVTWRITEIVARYALTTALYLFAAVRTITEDDEGFTPTALADLGLLAVLVVVTDVLLLPILAAGSSGLALYSISGLRILVPAGAGFWLHHQCRGQRAEPRRALRVLQAAAGAHTLYLAIHIAAHDSAAPLASSLQVLRWAFTGWAAILAVPGKPRAETSETALNNRELLVAALATAALVSGFGMTLLGGSAGPRVESLLLAALASTYAFVMLFRQAMVQLENRDLSRILRRESHRLRMVLDNIDDAVVTDDPGGAIQFANRRFYEMFLVDPDELPQYTLRSLTDPADRGIEEQAAKAGRKPDSERAVFQYRGQRTDGSTIYLERCITPVYTGGLFQGTQSVVRDISRQSLMARSQRAMAQRLEFFVSKMPLGCIIWDVNCSVQEWNDSAAKIFGWTHPEVLYRRYGDFLATPSERHTVRDWWRSLVATKSTSHQTCENLTKHRGLIECEWFHTSLVDDNGDVVAVASMVQDVTERNSLERQLVQSQKMEALGTLAGGVAHDFNNLLTTILGHISLALMRLPAESPVLRGLREAETAAERAADVAQQLLRFGRKSPVELKAVNLNDCVREMTRLLEHTIDPKVELELMLQPDLWLVRADATQVEQVVMNLCVNARDAIGQQGRITIEAANEILMESTRRPHPDAEEGEFVRLSVIDNGCGMSDTTRARIFEPFFTTKHHGKGSGLGLAMVYAIVRNHRGWVEVFTKEGQGSAFHVYLPRTHKRPSLTPPLKVPPAERGAGTIVRAEDEAPIRAFVREVLEEAGYAVIEAADGQQAVERYDERRDGIDLAVLDIIMPRKSGREAAKQIREMNPVLPIIFSSGYTVDGSRGEEWDFFNASFLQKPYKPQMLVSAVQEALARSPVEAPPA